jgi:hypothetical protein
MASHQAGISSSSLDGRLHAAEGRLWGGISFSAAGLAFIDWSMHLANAPFRSADLANDAIRQWVRFAAAAGQRPAISQRSDGDTGTGIFISAIGRSDRGISVRTTGNSRPRITKVMVARVVGVAGIPFTQRNFRPGDGF